MEDINVPKEEAFRIALLYPRISAKKQNKTGDGLNSQEHRLRHYCIENGWHIERVFREIKSAKGKVTERPKMVELLKYLEANRHTKYVVVFDDFLRFSRDGEFYWPLKRALERCGADLKCPNFTFEDTPEGRHAQTSAAANGQLQREQIARQTRQKMQDRLERGFAVFKAPVGYKYVDSEVDGGMVLVKHEHFAPIIKDALEGYASGRFQTQAEVKRFLESIPDFPRDYRGEVRAQQAADILTRSIYAGYIEHAPWGVSLREGKHEPLISYETFQIIQDRLQGKARAPARKDLAAEFPLRGTVICGDCCTPVTGYLAKGRGGYYPYYHCPERTCQSYGKSIQRAKLEGEFETLLKTLQPSPELFRGFYAMARKVWDHRLTYEATKARSLEAELKNVQQQSAKFLDRIVETDAPAVIAAYEKRIQELDQQKVLLSEKIRNCGKPLRSFDDSVRTGLHFLASPYKVWNSGALEHKRMVLRLAFDERLVYDRNEGFRTANFSLPFRMLRDLSGAQNQNGVPKGRKFEPAFRHPGRVERRA